MIEQPQPGPKREPVRPSISAFFPAYNDGGTIPSMVLTALMTLRRLSDDYEVVVVNDGSSDYTPDVLAGFRSATKELVFYTDGDAQYDPRELERLYEVWGDDVDFVNGYKISRSDPLHRIVIGRLYHWIVKLAFGLRLRDVDCDFRLMRRSIFDTVELKSDSGVICVELMKKVQDAGFRIAEVPVHHYHRAYGKSQFFNFRRLWRTGKQLLTLWWELRWPQLIGRAQPQERT